MENFINKIIELDNSIEGLEEDFKGEKSNKDTELKKEKENLINKYDEVFKSKREEFKEKFQKEIEDEERAIDSSTEKSINKVKNAYLNQKDTLIEEVFTNHFSKGSD